MPSPAPQFRWNASASRYVARNGQFVKRETVLARLTEAGEAHARALRSVTEDLRAGKVSLARWQLEMATNLRGAHLASAAVAKGGWAQLDQRDFGRVGRIIRDEYAFLGKRAAAIADGTQKLDGTLTQRAEMYGRAARVSFFQTERAAQAEAGAVMERRVLGAAEHCPDCVELAGRGWQPIGTLPPLGASRCLVNCVCHFEYGDASVGL